MSQRPVPRIGLVAAIGGGAAALLVVWTSVAGARSEADRQKRRYDTWFIEGPDCPTASDEFDRSRPTKTFAVNGVQISRRHGHMACRSVLARGGRGPGTLLICHTISPGRLEVRTASGVHAFDPGEGGPATLMVDQTGVSCVARSNPALIRPMSERAYD